MKRIKTFALVLLLLAGGYLLNDLVRLVREFDTSYHTLCTLQTGVYDAYIDICSPTWNEVSTALMYRVRAGGQVESPLSFMTTVGIERRIRQDDFSILTAKDGALVAVVLREKPDSVLAMYDFSTGETWPKPGYSEGFTSTRARGERMLEFFRQSKSNRNLSLDR
jgi:hypothetical protein